MIRIENLTKSYRVKNGRHHVFRSVNAVFPEGANIGIIGPNGAGKSTLLRILGGIDFPDSGRVSSTVSFSWPLGLKGGFIKHATGRENCRMICNLYGLHPRETRKQLEKVRELSGIDKYFEEPVMTYSSGMNARLGFALSMSFDFDYFLIDEITSVGDAKFKAMAKSLLKEKTQKARVIMVSHSVGDIKQFCDVGVLVKDGRLNVYKDLDHAIDAYLMATSGERTRDSSKNEAVPASIELTEAELPSVESLPSEIQALVRAVITHLKAVKQKLHLADRMPLSAQASAFSLFGGLYQKLGNPNESEKFHRMAVQIDPSTLVSHQALADLAARRGDFSTMGDAISSAEAVDGRNPKTVVQRARQLLSAGATDEARKRLEFSLKETPDNADVWHAYADALSECGDLENALKAQFSAIKNAQKTAYYQQLSRLLEGSGEIESSVLAYCKSCLFPAQTPRKRLEDILKLLERLDGILTVQ